MSIILGFKTCLAGATAPGHAVVRLTAKVINEWYDCSWYELFHDRYV